MNFFTPICNFQIDPPIKWMKMSKLKLRPISEAQALRYFGVKREFDKKGRLIHMSRSTDEPAPFDSPGILTEFQKLNVYASNYAFVSDLDDSKEHGREIWFMLNAFWMSKLHGVTCPTTFDNNLGQYFMPPMESKLDKTSIFSKSELRKIARVMKVVPKCKQDDLKLLRLVVEHGSSILSLVFLVMIVERIIMRGERGEIAFKVRLYAAKLLSKHFHFAEEKVFDTLKLAYDLRSDFIHSGRMSQTSVSEVFPILYDYATELLIINAKHLNQGNSLKRMLFKH